MKPLIYFTIVTICAAAATQIPKVRIYTDAQESPNGQWTIWADYAAYPWQPPQTTPYWSRDKKIVAEYANGRHQFVYYWDGRFRNEAGQPQAVPVRWAYLRLKSEVWNGTTWELPDGEVKYVPSLADSIKGLAAHYTRKQVMDEMDKHRWMAEIGAPEE